jgi:hypothetical protein
MQSTVVVNLAVTVIPPILSKAADRDLIAYSSKRLNKVAMPITVVPDSPVNFDFLL